MFSVPQPPPGTSQPHSKLSIFVAFALCPVLLGVSVYGFWEWFLKVTLISHLINWNELVYLTALVVVPLVLLLLLSIRATKKLEYNRLAAVYKAHLDQLQNRLNSQERFLRLITDSNPESLTIYDKENRYWFANLSATQRLGYEANEITKKAPEKIIGYERAQKLEKRLNDVRVKKRSIESLDQVKGEGGQVRFLQAHYELIPSFGDIADGVMVRESDVTNLIVERERRSSMLRQVIGTLVAVVDRRDPFAAGHSARVGQLSRLIAEEMLLPESEIDAAEIAGSLMNFGKVLVPRKILTKASALTPEELQLVRDSILTSAEILSIIDFDGPVVPTLRQVLERYDGTGVPHNLKADDILMTGRIVAVANAYVALVSPRAHRPSLSLGEALTNLTRGADVMYDRRVVTALANCVKNRRDTLDWAMGAEPK